MLMLQQWKLSEGTSLGQVAFSNLLRLLRKLVHDYGDQPNLFPHNYQQILECEKRATRRSFETIELSSGGFVMMTAFTDTIQTMFQNPTIFSNLHVDYNDSEVKGPLWTGSQWKVSQERCQELCPDNVIHYHLSLLQAVKCFLYCAIQTKLPF